MDSIIARKDVGQATISCMNRLLGKHDRNGHRDDSTNPWSMHVALCQLSSLTKLAIMHDHECMEKIQEGKLIYGACMLHCNRQLSKFKSSAWGIQVSAILI